MQEHFLIVVIATAVLIGWGMFLVFRLIRLENSSLQAAREEEVILITVHATIERLLNTEGIVFTGYNDEPRVLSGFKGRRIKATPES